MYFLFFLLLGQYASSVFNVYNTSISCIAYYLTGYSPLVKVTTKAVLHYFVYDTMYIIVKAHEQWPYIIHHLLSIYIGTMFTRGNIPQSAMIPYILNIELSNIVFVFYSYNGEPKSLLFPLCITYVPLRTFVLTYTTRAMIVSTSDLFLKISCSALLVMSYIYSGLLIKKLLKKN